MVPQSWDLPCQMLCKGCCRFRRDVKQQLDTAGCTVRPGKTVVDLRTEPPLRCSGRLMATAGTQRARSIYSLGKKPWCWWAGILGR